MTIDISSSSASTGNPNISWPTSRPSSSSSSDFTWRPARPVASQSPPKPPPLDSSNFPSGSKSLSAISIRAFLLGTALGLFTLLTILLAYIETHLWRVPFFLASLALFHFLEFWVTAEYNTRFADVSAFLLSSNGWAYNVAHGSAVLECLISYTFFSRESWYPTLTTPLPGLKLQVALGISLMLIGQIVRTIAMAQAGSNFNHTVQVEHRDGHQLVRHGIYAFLRHPSYFGFFWWGLGTQFVLGNMVCFLGYAIVLWRFFSSRISREEKFLIAFFGDEYVEYRKATRVGIPGIP